MERYREVMVTQSINQSYRIRHGKSPETPPGGKITMTSYPACNKTSLSRKPCIPDNNLLWTLSGSHGRSFRICHEKSRETLPGGRLTMTSCPVGNKTSLSRKPCIADKKLLWITIMKSWSLRNFYKKTTNINFKNLSVYKCC